MVVALYVGRSWFHLCRILNALLPPNRPNIRMVDKFGEGRVFVAGGSWLFHHTESEELKKYSYRLCTRSQLHWSPSKSSLHTLLHLPILTLIHHGEGNEHRSPRRLQPGLEARFSPKATCAPFPPQNLYRRASSRRRRDARPNHSPPGQHLQINPEGRSITLAARWRLASTRR